MNTKKLLIISMNVVLLVALVCGILLSIPTSMQATKVAAKIDSKQLTEEEQKIIDEAVLDKWKNNGNLPTTLTELTSSTTISTSGDAWYYLKSDVNLTNTSAITITGGHIRILLNGYSLTGTEAINVTHGTLSVFDKIPNQNRSEYTYNTNGLGSKTNIPLNISSSTINLFGTSIENTITANGATINLINNIVQSIINKNISNISTTVKAIIQNLVNETSAKLKIQYNPKGGVAEILSLKNDATFEIQNNAICTINTATGSQAILNEGILNVSGSVPNVTNAANAVVKIIDNNANIAKLTGSGTLEIAQGTDFEFKSNQLEEDIEIANHGNLIIPENMQVPNKIENAGALTVNEGASIDNLSQQKDGTATVKGEINNLNFEAGKITLASPGKLPTAVTIPQDGTLELKKGTNIDKIENSQGGTLIVEDGAQVNTVDSSGKTSIKGDVNNVVVNGGHTTIGDHANVNSAELNQGILEISKDANLQNLGHNNQGGTLIDNRKTPIIEQRRNINFIWIFNSLAAAILLLLTILIIFAILRKRKEYTYSEIIDIKTAQYAKNIQYNKNQKVLL